MTQAMLDSVKYVYQYYKVPRIDSGEIFLEVTLDTRGKYVRSNVKWTSDDLPMSSGGRVTKAHAEQVLEKLCIDWEVVKVKNGLMIFQWSIGECEPCDDDPDVDFELVPAKPYFAGLAVQLFEGKME